jgi:hypothetical protein
VADTVHMSSPEGNDPEYAELLARVNELTSRLARGHFLTSDEMVELTEKRQRLERIEETEEHLEKLEDLQDARARQDREDQREDALGGPIPLAKPKTMLKRGARIPDDHPLGTGPINPHKLAPEGGDPSIPFSPEPEWAHHPYEAAPPPRLPPGSRGVDFRDLLPQAPRGAAAEVHSTGGLNARVNAAADRAGAALNTPGTGANAMGAGMEKMMGREMAMAGGPMGVVLQAVKQAVEGLKMQGEGVKQALGSEKLEDKISGTGRFVEGVGKTGMSGGVEWMGKFIGAIGDGTTQMREWIKGLHDANTKFAEFSAAMAQVNAEQQLRDMELSQKRGERRAESAGDLAKSMHDMNVQFAKLEDHFATGLNKIGARVADLGEWVLKYINWAMRVKDDKDENAEGETLTDWFRDLGLQSRAGERIEDYGRGSVDDKLARHQAQFRRQEG